MRQMYKSVGLGLCMIGLLAVGSCLEKTPEELSNPVVEIPIPNSLSAVVGATQVSLSWNFNSTFTYSKFFVYRSEDGGATYTRAGSATVPPFVDTTLRSGVLYLYKVSGVDAFGVEGSRSVALAVRTTIYGLVINGDQDYTNNRNVTLSFVAPSATQFVRFSEDPAFPTEPWLSYKSSYNFEVSNGDGAKMVYASFIDQSGNTTESVNDVIILDRVTSIQSATYTPSSPVPPGATLHFVITPVGNELEGSARITLQAFGNITAEDNGNDGDATADDGVYEKDFVLPMSFRGINLGVTTTFTDAAGNQSDPVESSDLDITDPPSAVFVYPPEDSTTTSIQIRWSESMDDHFDRYEVYRDLLSSVNNFDSPRVGTFSSSTSVTLNDGGLDEGVTYYYRVYVVNDLEEAVGSNVRLAQTQDIPPTPVDLDDPTSVTTTSLTLTWSQNGDSDFLQYRVYRATAAGVTDLTGTLVATIADRYQTFFDDSGLNTGANTYYYRVYVVDRGGNRSRSNEVSTAP